MTWSSGIQKLGEGVTMEPKGPAGSDHVCDRHDKDSVDYDAGGFGGKHPQVAH